MNLTHPGWEFYLLLIFLCLLVQGFFAMLEMASVSFNKVRLQYYVSKGNKRAVWLSRLLASPGRLFGTTLICVNGALQLGSECARRFYDSLGVNPDYAPLSQVFIVLIFAEIAPLFAGRRFAESAAMFGMPLLYAVSKLLSPIITFLDMLCRLVNRLLGSSKEAGLYLSREELQKILEEGKEGEFNQVVSNIFSLKNKTAKELMMPLSEVQEIPQICTVAEMRSLLTAHYSAFVPIYHKSPQNIVAIAYPRDLLRLAENKRVREYARPPWFITEGESVLAILRQFRHNNQSVAVVLNTEGSATGLLTLDDIVDEIFGFSDTWMSFEEVVPRAYRVIVDRAFAGSMEIEKLNREFGVHLEYEGARTLEELMLKKLGHRPIVGESVRIDPFVLTVEEVSLLGVKSVAVRTVF